MSDTDTVLDLIKEHDAKYVDFRFTDPRGKWQHLAHHIRTIDEDSRTSGKCFVCGKPAKMRVALAKAY